jgi:hypothetical protein
MEGILRKLQKVMKLTQKWKDFENNESLSKDLSNKYQCHRVSISPKIFIIFYIFFGDENRPPSLKGYCEAPGNPSFPRSRICTRISAHLSVCVFVIDSSIPSFG